MANSTRLASSRAGPFGGEQQVGVSFFFGGGGVKGSQKENTILYTSICLRICFHFPLLVLKGIYHYWKHVFIFLPDVLRMEVHFSS